MSLDDGARRLIVSGEVAARNARDPRRQKAVLQPQYELYIKVLSRSSRPTVERAEDYLRVVRAMREEHEFADLEVSSLPPSSVVKIAGNTLRVLDSYLQRLPRTVVLILERGVGVLTLFTLRGGSEPLEDRIALERMSKECVALLVAMMQQQDKDLQRIRQHEKITKAFFDDIDAATAALWKAMPASIRSALLPARSILYLPSAFGDLSAFPLELLATEDGHLGATRSVARLSSIRTLVELLSPGRMPSQLSAHGLVVRAQDSEELTRADEEADVVSRQFTTLGMTTDIELAPHVDSFRTALDRGLRAVHYCGHGFAGQLGESLPLAADELLGPHDFSQLSGYGTPFVYLSTCEVGRARITTTGSAAGVSSRLIEKGAPAVVGCLDSVPDLVARSMAVSFYEAAATMPLGEALAAARKACLKYPPSCWGTFAYFGDPLLAWSAAEGAVTQTRQKTVRWDSLVGRHLVVRSAESRQRALAAISRARDEHGGVTELLARVSEWLATSFQPTKPTLFDERLDLCLAVLQEDAVAGCELRMLLAMEALHGGYLGKRKPDLVLRPDEVAVGLFCAKAVHDMLGWSAFAIKAARSGSIAYEPSQLLHMLNEAIGALDGWRLEEPGAGTLLSEARKLLGSLQETHRVPAFRNGRA